MPCAPLASLSSAALTSFGNPLASAKASAPIDKMNWDWICIVPVYSGFMQSLPQSDCTASNSRSNDAVIRVYDDGGTVIQTHYHEGEFKSGELLLTSRRSSPKANAHDS